MLCSSIPDMLFLLQKKQEHPPLLISALEAWRLLGRREVVDSPTVYLNLLAAQPLLSAPRANVNGCLLFYCASYRRCKRSRVSWGKQFVTGPALSGISSGEGPSLL